MNDTYDTPGLRLSPHLPPLCHQGQTRYGLVEEYGLRLLHSPYALAPFILPQTCILVTMIFGLLFVDKLYRD